MHILVCPGASTASCGRYSHLDHMVCEDSSKHTIVAQQQGLHRQLERKGSSGNMLGKTIAFCCFCVVGLTDSCADEGVSFVEASAASAIA